MSDFDNERTRLDDDGARDQAELLGAGGGVLQLVVALDDHVEFHALPERPELVVGRSPESDVRVPHASVSRRHALLRPGPPITLEDLSSSNGTCVRGRRTVAGRPEAIGTDEVFQLGDVNAWIERSPPVHGAGPTASPHVVVDGHPLPVNSPAMLALVRTIDRVAPGSISVLLHGETGVGKEVIARTIHARSPRATAPFLGLNCAALSENLLESELFGYEKGAFTGAQESKPGLLENARGGTVLLDEVGELSLSSQAKLLRCLQEREVLRLGGLKPRSIDVRVVAATNRDLRAEVEAGRFRKDLYFRLNGLIVNIPALRHRPAEVLPLARHFLRTSLGPGQQPPSFSPAALRTLQAYSWPGNVRELRAVIDRAVLLCSGRAVIQVEHLALTDVEPVDLTPHDEVARAARPSASDTPSPPPPGLRDLGGAAPTPGGDLRDELQGVERQRIVAALESCGGNQSQAAKLLGISRNTLVRRIEAYGLPRPRKREGADGAAATVD